MAEFDDYMKQFAVPTPAPVVEPAMPTPADIASLGQIASSPDAMLSVNEGLDRGNTEVLQNPIIADFQAMDSFAFREKYGADIAAQMGQISIGNVEQDRMNNGDRTTGERAWDAGLGVAKGLVGGVADAGTLAAGIVNEDAGVWAAQTTDEFRKFMDGNQSEGNKRNRYMSGVRAQLDEADNAAQYKRDGDGFEAGLSYLGRGIVNGTARFIEDPQSLETGLTEGVGSLFAGGVVGKGLGIAGKLAGVGRAVTTKALMPASIGAMEGGSAYNGAVVEVMGMDHTDLMENSPAYRQMIETGLDPVEAKKAVAARAGEIAGAIQAPIGALTGKLVAGFEANPLGSKTISGLMKNILNETVEEGIQSGSGQIAQNLGVQQADETKGTLEGVGDQIAQGAILGSLTAGVVQAPAVPGIAINNAVSALTERANANRAANDAGSGVTPEDVAASAEVATSAMEGVVEAVSEVAAAVPEEMRQAVDADNFTARVAEAITLVPEEIQSLGQATGDYLDNLGTPQFRNKIDMLQSLSVAAADENAPQEVRESAGLFILNQMRNNARLFDEDLQEGMAALPQDGPVYNAIKSYSDVLKQVTTTPAVRQAMVFALQKMQVTVPETGPIAQQTVNNAVSASAVKPSAIQPAAIRTILKQADEGNVTVTPEQRKALRVAASVYEQAQQVVTDTRIANETMGYTPKNVEDVASEILTKGKNADWGLSVDQHIGRINDAMLKGNLPVAQASVKHFRDFALSQRNKAAAALRSYRSGKPEQYSRLGSFGRMNPVPGVIDIHASSPGSVALARRIVLEAEMLGNTVNDLMSQYPEASTEVVPGINRPAEFFGGEVTPAPEGTIGADGELQDGFALGGQSQEQEPAPVSETMPVNADLNKRFPLLIKSKEGINRFINAFNLRDNKAGPMLELGKPLQEFMSVLKDEAALKAFVGSDVAFDVTTEEREALFEYLRVGGSMIYSPTVSLHKRLDEMLNRAVNKKTTDTYKQKIDVVSGWPEGRVLALTENIDGDYRYNAALVETAMLAALHWFAQPQNRTGKVDRVDAAKTFGLKDAEITPTLLAKLNNGVGMIQAARGLADTITQFWGLSGNRDASDTYVKGIPEAMAKEILETMVQNGWIRTEEVSIPGSEKKPVQLIMGRDVNPDVHELVRNTGMAKKLLSVAAVPVDEAEEATYGAPPKRIAKTQMRNKAVSHTKTQIKVLRAAQKIPFQLYRNSFDMQTKIGLDAWIELMGSTVINDETPFNIEHKKSIEGRNRTMAASFEAVAEAVQELEAHALIAEENPEDYKKYYQFNYSRVNRLQMLGSANPQSDKIARHVFLPTRATIDMSNPDQARGFWMAMAQGLGVKTQNFTAEENAQQGRDLIEGKFSPLVQELTQWLKDGKQGSLSGWAKKVGPGLTEHGIMSLLSAAEYQVAKDAGTLSSFTTHNYFEADGVTNGAANALMNLSSEVNTEWIETVKKGGAFFGKTGQTMASLNGQPDLYQGSAQRLAKLMKDGSKNLPEDVLPISQSLFRMMRGLGMKIDISGPPNDPVITIDRKVLKNPLTITIYGSGVDGIAGNVASEITERFYEAISEHLQKRRNTDFGDDLLIGDENYTADLFWFDYRNLTENTVENRDGLPVLTKSGFVGEQGFDLPANETLGNVSLDANEFRALKANVRALFVDNMRSAISDEVMHHVGSMVDSIQKATNAQSIVMTYMFRREMARALANKKPGVNGWKAGDSLSANEMDAILKRLMPYAALIKTDHQTFFLGSGERGNILESTKVADEDGNIVNVKFPDVFSLSTNKTAKTPAYGYAPAPAGVAGVPSFNIGTGDGRMIDVFLENMNGLGVLPVFDGINIPVDKIAEGSQLANRAVMTTWSENPAKHAAESFKAFMRQNPIEDLSDPSNGDNFDRDEFLLELTKNFAGMRVKEAMTAADLQNLMEDLDVKLTDGAEAIQDRMEAMKDFPLSVDQMSGGSSPYTQDGSVKLSPNASSADIARALELKIKQVRAARTKGEVVQSRDQAFVQAFRTVATTDVGGAMVTNIAGMEAIRKALGNKLSNTQREMLNATIQSLSDSNLTVVFGSPEQVDRYEQTNYPDTYLPNVDAYYGKYDVENNVIFLTNPSAETVTHELLHAATITKMQGYYADKSSVSQNDAEAIARMEGLMTEWLTQSYEREGPVVGEAHRMAVAAIMGHRNAGNMPAALNEFLAWSLSNQNLIRLQKKMQVKNPLFMLMGKALFQLKKLIWGHKKSPEIGMDMFSQVRFNARVLMSSPTPVALLMRDFGDVVLYQSKSFGSDDRLSQIRKEFSDKVFDFVGDKSRLDGSVEAATDYVSKRQDALDALIQHGNVAKRFAAAFHFNMQQSSTFKMIGAALSVSQHLNAASINRMQDIFDEVISKISVEDFMTNQGDEQIDRYQAQEKFNALTGVGTTVLDKKERSSLLPNFIALATVDDQFRSILRAMKMPAKVMDKSMTPDALIERAGSNAASALSIWASGQKKGDLDLSAAMDALVQNMIENVGDQRSFIEHNADNGLDNIDGMIQTYVEKGAARVEAWASTLSSPIGKKAGTALTLMSKMFTVEGAKQVSVTANAFGSLEEIRTPIREAISEIIGRTRENAPIFDMISRVRTFIDQTRQRWREEFPKELRQRFSRPLMAQEWSDLHNGVGRTDVAGLFKSYRQAGVLDLLSSGSSRQAEIASLKSKLSGEKNWKQIDAKAQQLAEFMVTGKHGAQLQRNAYAIAKLNGALESEQDIDNLVSLYAIDRLPDATLETMERLIQEEKNGFLGVYYSVLSARQDEVKKSTSGLGRMNGYKGHLKGQAQAGVHLLIAEKTQHGALLNMDYEFLGDYQGSSSDVGQVKKGYYFAPVSGKAKFNQGVLQTVQTTQFGVDPETGHTIGEINAGRITDQRAVAAITKRIMNQTATDENLLPIYNENGTIIGYERAADPKKLAYLNETYDLAQAVGAWKGRQTEEISAQEVNKELVDKVYDIWSTDRGTRSNEFVRVDTSTDPIISDAWGIIPRSTKEYIKAKFGEDGFRVRRSDVLDVIGARSATVGDLWTGNSRWSPETQKAVRDMAVGFLGNKAYRVLTNAESTYQSIVSDVKVLIVIKSVVVPVANLLSNVYQLSMAGVPIRNVLTGMKDKTAQLNAYIQRREQERLLQNDLFVAEGAGDTVNIRKLSTRLQTLKDSYKRMDIWPLIEAGEFGAITDGVTTEDLAISKGGYQAMVEKIIKKLPNNGVRDVARYGMITRDTSLFKALSRATQYGDFLAKAVLYDDLTKRRKMSQGEALAYVNEEFINYNRFAGRNRAYQESMGITWFWHFKLRSMKIAQRSMQRNPFRALLHTALTPRIPLLGTIGNPITDNMLSVLLDNRLGYSIGPGMIMRAPQLNPWASMIE